MKQVFEELKPEYGETFQIHTQVTTQTSYSPPHIHDFIEILYCFQGEYQVFVGDREYVFCPGDMIVINSRQIHECYPRNASAGEYLVVKFQPEMIYACYNSAVELQYALPFLFGDGGFLAHPKELEHVFQNIARELQTRTYGYELAMKSGIYQIILWITRCSGRKPDTLNFFSEETIRKIISAFSYIEKHYTEDISVRQIAGAVYMEYTYFSRIFRQFTKKSCTEYINHFRIQKAESLLLAGNLNITEISVQVGFDNVSYFIKQFRKFRGISPKQYQINLQKRLQSIK